MLDQKEKILLIILIIATILCIFITLFLSNNYLFKENFVVNQKIHIIHVSGEFENNFEELYNKNISNIGDYDIHIYKPLLKSSNVISSDWNKIAQSIFDVYNKYDAFVIVHGKDTLTYTASALSFMFEDLGKPIILTDGEVVEALIAVSINNFPEVMIFSKGNITRGCRTIAYSNSEFISPNYPYLTKETTFMFPKKETKIKLINEKINIIVVKMFPGIDDKYLEGIIKNSVVHGLILETYGKQISSSSKSFLSLLNFLSKKGIIIINVSQYNKIEYTDIDLSLSKVGVLQAYDITTEACFTKLQYLLSNIKDKKLIEKLFEISMRGEINIK
jgi:L-asparaginase